MHLFEDDQSPEFHKSEDEPAKLARKLYQALLDRRILFRRVSLKVWTNCFSKLIDETHPYEEVHSVLDWYLNNVNISGIKVASAYDFCEKYDKILFEKNKDTIVISSSAELLIKYILPQYQLPTGVEQCLHFVVEQSLQNARKFVENIKSITTEDEKIKRSIQYLKEIGFLNLRQLVVSWLETVLRPIEYWQDWHGNTSYLILDVNSPKFNSMGRQAMVKWCGTPGRWDEVINYNKMAKV